MAYRLGVRSRLKLIGVHPMLGTLVRDAIEITDQDFAVVDGLRDADQQRELVARGASQRLKCKHLRQRDCYGHAVDLVPVVGGVARWEWPLIYPVARAMWLVAHRYHVALTWGGVWDRPFLDLSPSALEIEVENYVQRRRKLGRSAFIDGPHYQLEGDL